MSNLTNRAPSPIGTLRLFEYKFHTPLNMGHVGPLLMDITVHFAVCVLFVKQATLGEGDLTESRLLDLTDPVCSHDVLCSVPLCARVIRNERHDS